MVVDIQLMEGATLPKYQTEGSAGMDLVAYSFTKLGDGSTLRDVASSKVSKTITVRPHHRVLIGTGLMMAIPEGFELQIRPRSGLALKKGITVLNSPGTIDSDYRQEIGVILVNNSMDAITISLGDRIAQGVFARYEKTTFEVKESLNETSRVGGFGHTGK